MDATRFARLRAVYERAADLPHGERTPYLDEACGGDEDLRREAERMLAARNAPFFLARPDEAGELGTEPAPLPERIGPYRIRALLGAGGFGVVYRAEQTEPVERTVALKVLHRRRADERAILRFEAECQTLALMQHAGIAQLYDAGRADDGQLYFAMELVDGLPVTAWSDRRRLGIDERLELFLRVCAAVQHAHQRGVVHRDFKPSNVLVKEEDGRATPKVIDFGIAKLLEDEGGRGLITREGVPLGTPGYMSPEQAAGGTIDTRTDVYALGVMLYDLLAGDLPFPRQRLASGSPAEVLRILREEEPRRMSTAVLEATESVDAVAERRGCDRTVLMRALRGDLEWIVRKALEKNPDARYASVSALIADVERFRHDAPVAAREPAAVYVARKFVARHRLGVGIAVASILLLVVVVSGLAWALRAVSDARDDALDQGARADAQRDRAVLNEYAAHLAAARSALQSGDVNGARRHLELAAIEHRGWEWRHLAGRCDTSTTRLDVGSSAWTIAWLDEERILVRRAETTALEILDARTGRVEHRLPTLGAELDDFLLDRPRNRVIVDGRSHLELWDLDQPSTPEILYEARGFEPPHREADVRAMALSPDGTLLYTSENSGAVRVFDLEGEHPPRVLCWLDAYCWSIEVLGNGERLALGSVAGRIELRDARSGAELLPPLTLHREDVKALAASADGRVLYAAAGDTLQAWSAVDGTLLVRRRVAAPLVKLELSPDGDLIYGCGERDRGGLTAWDATTLEIVSRFHGHRSGVHGLAIHPDGGSLASSSEDGTVRIWPALAPPAVRQLDAGYDAGDLSVSPDGEAFAAVDARGRVTVWSASTLAEELRVELEGPLRGCALGADEAFVVGTRLEAVDRRTGAVRAGDPPPRPAGRLTLDPEERWLLAVARSGEGLVLWRLPQLELAHVLELRVDRAVAFDPHRDAFVVSATDGGLVWIDPDTGRVTDRIDTPGPIEALAVDADTERLALAGEGLELFEGGRLIPWRRAVPAPIAVAFAPGSRRLATGGWDASVRILDLEGTELLVLDDALKPVQEVYFALGGRRLIARSHLPGSPSYALVWSAPESVTLER